MADCECLPSCPFFLDTMPGLPAVTTYLKTLYCRRNYLACARYMVRQSLGKEKVPSDLYPDDISRAYRIILAGKQKSD